MGKAYDLVIERLQGGGFKTKAEGRDRMRAQCPSHGGDDLNLSVAVGDQGVLLKCQSYDCPAADIASALNLSLSDLFDADGKATYVYDGGHKVTRQRTRDGKKILQQNKPAVTHLYRHEMSIPIEESNRVVLVEGEKCVDAALRLGEPCVTTWPGGAKAVDQVDLSPLFGKEIIIIADNDEPGLKAAARLVTRLAGVATVQGVWVVPGEKQGVDDLWLRGGSLTELVAAEVPLDQELEEEHEPPARSLSLRSLSTVSSKRTRFLWEKMIPQSAVTLAAGRGGTGKSSFMIWLAAQLNQGALAGELLGHPAPVLYVSHEDSLAEVVAPRADANGVVRDLFYSLSISSRDIGGETVPSLPEDMPLIRQAITETGAKLLIIDPITSTLAGGDNDKMADVRRVMDPLNAMAAELSVSVIGIAHFRKGGGSASDLISGSHAWRDAARAVMLFARDEDADATVMTLEKINSGEAGKSFRYRLNIIQQMTDEGHPTDVARVVWEGESTIAVADLINHETERQKQGGLANELTEYIRSFEGRAIKVEDIVSHFSNSDVKPATVRQNLKRLAGRGVIEQPAYGHYQAVMPTDATESDTSRARGGVTPVTPVTLRPSVTGVTPVTPTPAGAQARASVAVTEQGVDPSFCTVCGGKLSAPAIEEGETRHDIC
ncbi:DNA primase [Microbacterium phage Hyperion]|uniref:DNA primase n=1 Tax=Microbacterium phage Hyperion TaxID=2182354 RepID=A0A2U8UIS1_9CAUD|nr:DNA polymerase/primase [Microbacterium phage Hyperion]AWN03584.1 DNA primase [Microbacterium phage Hyperion]